MLLLQADMKTVTNHRVSHNEENFLSSSKHVGLSSKSLVTCFSYNSARFDNDLHGYALARFCCSSSRVYRYSVSVTGTF
jgi:hypothetical protein